MQRQNLLLLTFISIVFFFSCQKGTDSPPPPPPPTGNALTSFTVTVSNRQAQSAVLNWTASINNNNSSPVKYRVLLGNTTVASDLSATNFTLTSLVATSTYTGKVMAYTSSGDTASATFSVGIYTPTSNYGYVTGYYKVTESCNGGATPYYHTFTGRVDLINDSMIAFTQRNRVPFVWWTTDFTCKILSALGDSLSAAPLTPKGRILNQTTIRMNYLFGGQIYVYNVNQLWEKLQNPADSNLYAYTYPNFIGMIKTVAGSSLGTSGMTGDGGPATAALLTYPYDVVVDNQGNFYMTSGNTGYSIRKVNTAGIISRYAGNNTSGFSGDNGPAINAQIANPMGLAIDNSNNLYISEVGNRIIRKVNSSGVISTIAGTPGVYGYSGDGGPATSATLRAPYGIAIDAAGNLYIADVASHVVRKVSTAGIITTVAGMGTSGYSGDNGPATSAKLNAPTDIGFDQSGNMYIADRDNNVIRKVTPAGIITTYAGIYLNPGFTGDGGPATSAKLNKPYSITFDNTGNLYFSDQSNDRIRKITPAGIINTYTGGSNNQYGAGPDFYGGDYGPAASAWFSNPYGIAWVPSGLFICDRHQIRKVRLQ